jgi:dihydrofolate reductase
MGGGEIARAFLAAGVVDEVHLMLFPVLLGQGIPFFPPAFPQQDLELIENAPYPKGLISLKYRRL